MRPAIRFAFLMPLVSLPALAGVAQAQGSAQAVPVVVSPVVEGEVAAGQTFVGTDMRLSGSNERRRCHIKIYQIISYCNYLFLLLLKTTDYLR